MNNVFKFNLFELFQIGFLAPINSAKFLKRNKWLMFMSLAPHLIGLFIYLWSVKIWIIPWIKSASQAFHNSAFIKLLEVTGILSIYLLAILLFSILGLPIISKLSSPIQDYISAQLYEHSSGKKLPNLTLLDTFRLFLSECSKLIILLIASIISIFIPFLSPFIFIISIWYLGWDHLDRCWSLKGLRLKQRLVLGFLHFPACLGLGLWCYIPFAGTLFGFVMTAAGGHIVGYIDTFPDLIQDNKKGKPIL